MRRLLIAFLLLFSAPLWAEDGKEPFFSQFRDWYCIAGVPFNNPAGITGETIDVKFQFSVKFLPIRIGKQWNLYFGYTHKTVWNAFGESAPFHDNAYMPGIYFIRKFEKGDGLILGLEHMSNGRPYHGNPLAHEGYDDLSRGMNYVYALWSKPVGAAGRFFLQGKVGVGCGVGDYERHQNRYTQDLFVYYLGYLTAAYKLDREVFGLSASVTPIWNRSIANVNAEGWVRFAKKWPKIMMQFHWGYDEAMCDCVPDKLPPCSLRVGLVYNVSDIF